MPWSTVTVRSRTLKAENGIRPAIAFTLIEVMLVVAIMAILTAAAALTFAGPLRKAQSQEAVQQLRFFDASARDLARRWGRDVRLSFDLDRQILSRVGGPGSEPVTYRTSLPAGYRVIDFRTAGRSAESGQAVVSLSITGVGQTYALRLAGPASSTWIVFSGLTGEVIRVQNEAQLNAIFKTVASRDESGSGAFPSEAPPGRDAD